MQAAIHRSFTNCSDMKTQPRWALLTLGVWVGLLTGTLATGVHLALIAVARLNTRAAFGSEVGWLNAPLVDGVLFGGLGAALSIASSRFGRLVSFRMGVFTLAFVSWMSLLFLIPGLAVYSVVLLAAGAAAQTARRVDAQHSRVLHACVLTLPWLMAMAMGSAVWNLASPQIVGLRGRSALPPASSDAPNVIMIVLDTVRAESLSVYGHNEPTSPWLERFAKDGVLFERAFSTSPWTLPAHGTLFTGRIPRELSTDWESGLDRTHPTLAEVFASHGYLTAGFVANYDYASARTGLDRGFLRYDDHTAFKSIFGHTYDSPTRSSSTIGRIAPSWVRRLLDDLSHKNAPALNREFLDWLRSQPDRPIFAFLNYYDAHSPYRSPSQYDARFRSAASSGRGQGRLDAYEACIAYLDDQLRDLFTKLEGNGFLRNTIVVITSDHGEQFGEHGVARHGNSLYRHVLEVPLIIAHPGHLPGGMRVPQTVSIRDIAATVLDLAAIQPPKPLPGRSLARYWMDTPGSARTDDPVVSEVTTAVRQPSWLNSDGPMVSIVEHDFHYIKNFGRNEEELYHVLSDPRETRNLAASSMGNAWLPHFRSRVGPITVVDAFLEVSR